MIGDMQWLVSLECIDIFCATMTLSGFHAKPRVGHLKHAKEIIFISEITRRFQLSFKQMCLIIIFCTQKLLGSSTSDGL